jgi:pimeloyl-ACP methyl ester carboxylesterase
MLVALPARPEFALSWQIYGEGMHLVLIHGAGGSEATWRNVAPLLKARGHAFTLVRLPLVSLDGDASHTRSVVDAIDGPVLLVAHSYGGAVMTQVGNHPNVAGLVYIAAFAPDFGESVDSIVEKYDAAESEAFTSLGENGEQIFDRSETYWQEIGPDVAPARRVVLTKQSRPSAEEIYLQYSGEPAWAKRPSWYQVASKDRSLRPEVQRFMAARAGSTTSEVAASHFTPEVAPVDIVDLIETALASLRG